MHTSRTYTQLPLAAFCALGAWLAAAAVPLSGREPGVPVSEHLAEPIRPLLDRLDAGGSTAPPGRSAAVREALERFYRAGGYRPSWLDDFGRPTGRAGELIASLEAAERDGLHPGDYQPDFLAAELRRLSTSTDPEARHRADLLLSRAFALLVHDLTAGRAEPEELGAQWLVWSKRPDLAQALHEAAHGSAGVEATLAALRPAHPGYRRLGRALERYREIAREGGWPAVPDGPVLEPGKRAEPSRLEALGARLAAEDGLPDRLPSPRPSPATTPLRDAVPSEGRGRPATGPRPAADEAPAVYDEPLVGSVRRFQERMGLEVDGIVGPETLAALNVPAEERLRQLEVNLERWRRMPEELPERRVEVDLPGFRLRMVEDGRPVSEMRIVVGKPRTRTPVFRDLLTHVVLNPDWNVPPNIAARELRPKGSAWLSARGYETLPNGGLRQRPGAGNSLGRVKFVLDGQRYIYLHDTPEKHLFGRARRAFSHGCIRLERPVELAEWLLRGDPEVSADWTPERIGAAIARGRTAWIRLSEEVPVFVLYFTAWAGDGGEVHFRDDLYGFDQRLAQALEQQPPEAQEALLAAFRSTE